MIRGARAIVDPMTRELKIEENEHTVSNWAATVDSHPRTLIRFEDPDGNGTIESFGAVVEELAE